MLSAAMVAPDDPAGRVARLALIVGSCVTVGRLLAGAAPLMLLKAGVFAMATIDAAFIFGDFFGEQNAQFNAAAPGDLPQLQVSEIGNVSTDYGDFFVAGLVGGILAAERRPQVLAAVATFVVAQAFNQLFLVVDSLPGTVPPALRPARVRTQRASHWSQGGGCARAPVDVGWEARGINPRPSSRRDQDHEPPFSGDPRGRAGCGLALGAGQASANHVSCGDEITADRRSTATSSTARTTAP